MSDIHINIEGELSKEALTYASKALGSPEVQDTLRPIAEEALAYVEQISKEAEPYVQRSLRAAIETITFVKAFEELRPLVSADLHFAIGQYASLVSVRDEVRAFIEVDERARAVLLRAWELRFDEEG